MQLCGFVEPGKIVLFGKGRLVSLDRQVLCWFRFVGGRFLFLLFFVGGVFGFGGFFRSVVVVTMVGGDFFDAEGEEGGLE